MGAGGAGRGHGNPGRTTSNTKIQLRLPEELKDAATRQAAEAGVSLNLYMATALAAHVGARAETARYMTARAARATPARAKALLSRLGSRDAVRADDRLDASDGD